MLIKLLNDHLEYCNIIAETLFNEWKDEYIKYSSYKTVDLLLELYIKKNCMIIFVVIDENTKDFIGCFSLSKTLFKLYLCDVIVAKQYRNNGYGSEIVKFAIQYAKDKNYEDLYLYIGKNNNLISFYNNFGFKEDNHIDSYNRKRMVIKFFQEKKPKYSYILLLLVIINLVFFIFV